MNLFRKIFTVFFISIILISNTYAYELTFSDKIRWDIISWKIEKLIKKSNEQKREVYINQLKIIKSKSNNEKLRAIIDYVINSLSDTWDDIWSLFDNYDYTDNNTYVDNTYTGNYYYDSCVFTNKIVNWHNYWVQAMKHRETIKVNLAYKIANWTNNYSQSFTCLNWSVSLVWNESYISTTCNSWYTLNWWICTITNIGCGYTNRIVNWHNYSIASMNNGETRSVDYSYNIWNGVQIIRQSFYCSNWNITNSWNENIITTTCNNWYVLSWNNCIYSNSSYNYNNTYCLYVTKNINWHIYNVPQMNNYENRNIDYSFNINNWYQTVRQAFTCLNGTTNQVWDEIYISTICNNWYYQNWNTCVSGNNNYTSNTTIYSNWCNSADIVLSNWQVWAACNLWTNKSWIWSESYWNYYQWGRNKGFSFTDRTKQSTKIPNPNWNDNYGFVWDSSLINYDWITIQNDNLWWDVTNSMSARQWPCQSGRHVPTRNDWQLACDSIKWSKCSNIENDYNTISKIQNTLKLPFAWIHSPYDAGIIYDNLFGYYWSSSANTTDSSSFSFSSTSLYTNSNDYRANWFSVRCIRN